MGENGLGVVPLHRHDPRLEFVRRRQTRRRPGSRAVLGDEVSPRRPVPRRPVGGGHRRAGQAAALLLRHHRRRRLAHDRRRLHLGRTSPTASSAARSARSPSASPTRTSSTSAAARRPSAATSRTATACGNRPTPARPGSTSAWATRRHIPRVRIHPKNPDIVYAAALGHLYGPNKERGVFQAAPTAARPGSRCCSSTTKSARST